MTTPVLPRVADDLACYSQAVSQVESARSVTERLRAFATLGALRRLLDDALKTVRAEEDRLAEPLIKDMANDGLASANIDVPLLENKVERFNIHTRREFFCQKKADRDGVTQETVCAVLRQLGLADLCQETFDAAAVKGRLREWLANSTEIPRELRSVFQWGEVTRLVSSK